MINMSRDYGLAKNNVGQHRSIALHESEQYSEC